MNRTPVSKSVENFADLSDEDAKRYYLGVLSAEAEFCKKHPLYFSHHILGYPYCWMHQKWTQHMETSDIGLYMGPRGWLKSCHLTIGRGIILSLLRNPQERIAIFSETKAQASGFVQEAERHLEGNKDLIKIFGSQKGKHWTAESFDIRNRRETEDTTGSAFFKERSVMAFGVGTAVPSKHFTIAICDDIVSDLNSRTAYQRSQLKRWFYKVMMPCLIPGAKLWLVGVSQHPRDLYTWLMTHDCAKDKHKIFVGLNKKNESNWPAWESTEKLLNRLKNMGRMLFSSQYQQHATHLEKYFRELWMRDVPSIPDDLEFIIGVDPAFALDEGANLFAAVVVGKSRSQSKRYIVDEISGHFPLEKQVSLINALADRWGARLIRIESNAAAVLYQQYTFSAPMEPVFTGKDKETRAIKLIPGFEMGDIVFLAGVGEDVKDSLCDFPEGCDDPFDALEFALSGFDPDIEGRGEYEVVNYGEEMEGEIEEEEIKKETPWRDRHIR